MLNDGKTDVCDDESWLNKLQKNQHVLTACAVPPSLLLFNQVQIPKKILEVGLVGEDSHEVRARLDFTQKIPVLDRVRTVSTDSTKFSFGAIAASWSFDSVSVATLEIELLQTQ